MDAKSVITAGKAVLGIELGSTRIKAVLIDPDHRPIAQGGHGWENRLENKLWTYSLEDIHGGMQSCYASLCEDVRKRYGVEIRSLAAIGISAMMHGYMAFDSEDRLLVPFRTWRNTNTGAAAKVLSELFNFNMPQRWSLSHLYQCILDDEPHVKDVRSLNTLAGYVHFLLTGEKVLGVGDASGMMPIDPATGDFDMKRVEAFDRLVAPKGYPWKLRELLPRVVPAGAFAGVLTPQGAAFLDPTGTLQAGVPVCPPEGDAGTGMVATNAVRPGTGNVSAGTSSFSMIVLEKDLSQPYEVIDIVTTPDGSPVAMVHCNNCTSDINAWVGLFREYQEMLGVPVNVGEMYDRLFLRAMQGDPDCGGLVSFNYVSGELVTGFTEGRPLVVRSATDKFNLANLFRAQICASIVVLKIGNEILFEKEKVKVRRITGHGGLFKAPLVGQKLLAAALNSPISVMETAGEGGAWGIALLASYLVNNPAKLPLDRFLEEVVFEGNVGTEVKPDPVDVAGFDAFTANYTSCLPIERAAVECKPI